MAVNVKYFSTTCVSYKEYLSRQGRIINKIMYGAAQKKKYYKDPNVPILPSPKALNTSGRGQSGVTFSRRVAVLNKLFMKHVTDLMATGEASSAIVGRGIEISRVKVTSDFNLVNVFWLAKGTDNDDEIERILIESAPNIRHELSQLRLMGQVPRIAFVKDKQYAKISEVDARLAIADFGEDYEPTDAGTLLKSEFSLNLNLPNKIKDAINQMEYDNLEEINDEDDPLPPMRMNVLGLDHADILNTVKKSVKQSKLAWQNSNDVCAVNNSNIKTEFVENSNVSGNISNKNQKEQFTKFLQKRQLSRLKTGRKEKYNNQSDQELLWAEYNITTENDNKMDKEIDYIEELEDENKQ